MLNTIFETSAIKAEQLVSEMRAGKVVGFDWSEATKNGEKGKTIMEMIGTDDGAAEFVEKVTYDMFAGREAVNLVYPQFYRETVDAGLPRVLTMEEFGPTQVVFLQKFEGGEVKFGALGPGTEKTVRINTWAAGIEYSEDMVEYNEFWRLTEVSERFGEAYNHLLNHLHLSPIISASYTTTGGGLAAQKEKQEDETSGTQQLIAYDTSIKETLMNALQVLPRGTKLLINSFDRPRIEAAIADSMYTDLSASLVKRRLSSADLVEYDGSEVEVGGKTYTYTGVTAGEAYLIVPQRNFRSFVKHGLRMDSGDGDLSRLIVSQLVGRARIGVLASLVGKTGVVKVELE